MRKITLLMSLLCLLCVSAMAQVTSMADLRDDRCYTVVSPRSSWAVAAGGNELSTIAKENLTFDATDTKQQFAFVTNDGGEHYYLYCVGEKKFLKMDNTLTAENVKGQSVEFVAITSGDHEGAFRIRYKEDTGKNINIKGTASDGMIINGWSLVDAGTAYTITEVPDVEFDATEALAILNNYYTITYDITVTHKGSTYKVQEEAIAYPGEDIPAPASLSTGYVTATTELPTGEATETKTYSVSLTVADDFPFEYSATYGNDMKWYYLKLKDQNTSTNDGEKPKYIKYDSERTDKYAVTTDYTVDDCYLWAFVGNPVAGFTMVNKATGEQRLYAAEVGNGKFPMMSETNGTTWMVEKSTREGYAGRFGIKVSTASEYLNNYANNGFLSLWEQGPKQDEGSNVHAITELEGAKEKLSAMVANLSDKPLGSGLGQYHWADSDNAQAVLSAAAELANSSTATLAEIKAAIAQVAGLSVEINQPATGKFYRFKSATDENRRMTSTEEGNRMKMETEGGNAAPTVFYLDADKHLVALSNGLCVSKYMGGDQDNFWKCLLSDNEKAGTAEFKESGLVGKYNICMSEGRYLYSENPKVDCGGGDGNGYRWDVEEVTWLPVPINAEVGYGTLCSPVELALSYGRVKAYTGTIDGKYIELTELKDYIPANTPVVLEYVDGIEDGCVYLEITSTGATFEGDNCFAGAVLATATAETDGNCTLQQLDGDTGFFTYTGDTLYGFKAYVPAQGQGVRGFAFKFGGTATGIDGVEAGQQADEVLYDLNGRRVVYPANGIYVTASGKKVFVK